VPDGAERLRRRVYESGAQPWATAVRRSQATVIHVTSVADIKLVRES